MALGVSKNGVRDLVAALVKAGLAERAAYEHHTIIRALPRARRATLAAEGESRSVETSTGATFAALDAAMADVERVLARMEKARECPRQPGQKGNPARNCKPQRQLQDVRRRHRPKHVLAQT